MTGVVVHQEAVSAAGCVTLIDTYNACAPYSAHSDQHRNPVVAWPAARMDSVGNTAMIAAVRRCQTLTATAFEQQLYPETAILAALGDGQGHVAHADNEQLTDGAWVPNHTPQRDFAGILYLNSAFTGGQLRFPDRGREHQPIEGMYVTFPCTRDFVHEVTPVGQGRRYSLAVWFTTRPEHASSPLRWALGEAGAQHG